MDYPTVIRPSWGALYLSDAEYKLQTASHWLSEFEKEHFWTKKGTEWDLIYFCLDFLSVRKLIKSIEKLTDD